MKNQRRRHDRVTTTGRRTPTWVIWVLRGSSIGLAVAGLIVANQRGKTAFDVPIIAVALFIDTVFNSWDMKEDSKVIDARITELLHFKHLRGPNDIWHEANQIIDECQVDDTIKSTASFPNAPDFEKAIFQRVVNDRIFYKRLLCYFDEGAGSEPAPHGFTAFEDIPGRATRQLLESYHGWYAKFYVAWNEVKSNPVQASLGMKTWYDALKKVQECLPSHFDVWSHGSEIATDYFILLPHGEKPARAVVGFPKEEGEGMRGGLATTNSLFAKDLEMNWDRLWNRKNRPLSPR